MLYSSVRVPSYKSLDLNAFSPEAWKVLFGAPTDSYDIERLYEYVAPLYAAISLRASGLAGLPWRLRTPRGAIRPLDQDALADLLQAAEIDYLLHGAMYLFRDPAAPLGLRRLHPRTIRLLTDPSRGLTGFERRVGATVIQLGLDQMVWLWEPNARSEIGPGPSAAQRALTEARRVLAENALVASYYERGAVRPTIWMFDTPPPEAERVRFEGWLRRLVSGVTNAFRQLAVSQKVTAQTVGDTLDTMINPDATRQAVEAILTAFTVPHSLVLPSAANYATAERDWRTFVLLTLLPHARRIAARLTQQHAQQAYGAVLEVAEENVEALQAAELEKAEALQRLTGTVLTVNEARQRLELPAIDDQASELGRLKLTQQLQVVQAAVAAGIPLTQALALAGLADLPLPEAAPQGKLLPDPATVRWEELV
jgi:hypothetical protein